MFHKETGTSERKQCSELYSYGSLTGKSDKALHLSESQQDVARLPYSLDTAGSFVDCNLTYTAF